MEVLKESKEKLPVAFVTAFVSEGWEKVGFLKEELEAIKKEFSDTAKAEEVIQGLIDAYLVSIGQMEQYLSEKKNLEVPLTEDVTVNIDKVEIIKPKIKIKGDKEISESDEAADEIVTEPASIEAEVATDEPVVAEESDIIEEAPKTEAERLEEVEEAIKKEDFTEAFEYFVDEFPAPVKETHLDD